ncbi:MAG: restriction endonuclease [Verrucomicrobia bacterium]|nr:restriction endonuclease [Verrucomicrobiota bacterium]
MAQDSGRRWRPRDVTHGTGGAGRPAQLSCPRFHARDFLFQCKRYRGAVTPSQVRDFRGAVMGRAHKGLIISAGKFTTEARREARRDGVPPIELVDGDALVGMFEQFELGLSPKRTSEVIDAFFDEYRT